MTAAHEPAKYDLADIYAIRALEQGQASEAQQRRVLEWIVHNASNYHDLSYREDGNGGDRATAFAEGRRFVGLQIRKLLKPETLEAKKAAGNSRKRGTK